MKKQTVLLLFLCFTISATVIAQDNQADKRSKKDSQTKITITTADGKKVDFEEHMEKLGEDIGFSIERFFESFEMDWEGSRLNISFEEDESWEDFGKRISESVNAMVNHMDIEMTDVDPKEFEEQNFEFNNTRVDGSDILDEIEEEHNSPVKNIEKIDIKLREKEIRVKLRALLENGETVEKSYREFRD